MDKNEVLNSDCDVRVSVARNPNTPVDVLMELAKDSDIVVRRRVACNSNTPVDVLIELEKDSPLSLARDIFMFVMQHVIPICPSMCSQN